MKYLTCSTLFAICFVATAGAEDWSARQIDKFPKSEKLIRLFNGKDLTGWVGQREKYFSVKNGTIVAKNGKENLPKVRNYLMTEKNYRNFRLVFEAKLVESKMNTGIAFWGKKIKIGAEPFSYRGHLVMFPDPWGFWDLERRNYIVRYKNKSGKKTGQQHDWNQMEILAIGNRIRHVVNGRLIIDWSDPQPELCQPGPIGLQLHSNKVPQEIHFRGLILSEDPEDRVITVTESPANESE